MTSPKCSPGIEHEAGWYCHSCGRGVPSQTDFEEGFRAGWNDAKKTFEKLGPVPDVAQVPATAEEKELFAAATKIDVADAVKHIRNWMSYIDDHHRQKYADLIEAQAKLIAWLVEQRRSGVAQSAPNPDELGYATRLLEHFVAEHFPHNPDWKPLPELIGVLTQLDNAITIARDYKEKLRAYEGSTGEMRHEHDRRSTRSGDA
jgi:hypothetical protein